MSYANRLLAWPPYTRTEFGMARLRATHRLDQLMELVTHGPRSLEQPWWQQLADRLAHRVLGHPRHTEELVWQYRQEENLRQRRSERQVDQIAAKYPRDCRHQPVAVG